MRVLQVPKQLEIEGQTWHVYRESDAPKNLRKKGLKLLAEGVYGKTFSTARAIVLADGLADDHLEETFIHELLHALLTYDTFLGVDLEEHIVELLDAPLMRVLRLLTWKET